MANSPAVSRSIGHFSGASTSSSKRQYAERNPRTLVGLQKVNVQLKKELEKLDRQQTTAVNNIANHQQAMKMTWRRLEQKRAMESPLLSRGPAKKTEEGGARRGIFHSNTKLYVNKTPYIYSVSQEKEQLSDDTPTLSTTVHVSQADSDGSVKHYMGIPTSKENQLLNSPYVSSPFNYRRTQTAPVPHRAPIPSSNNEQYRKKELKLPPIASASQPLLVPSGTTNKKTLLQASAIFNDDLVPSDGHRSNSFTNFFAERPSSQASLLVSPMEPGSLLHNSQLKEESTSPNAANTGDDTTNASSELTLAEMFEQIKHCRYIRRYHPDGTALEEYY